MPTPEVESIIPHRSRMRLVDRYLAVDEKSASSETVVRASWPLTDRDRTATTISLELIAQTAAGAQIWQESPEETGDRFGFLAGVKSARLVHPFFPAGARLVTEASCEHLLDRSDVWYGTFQGRVLLDGEVLAEAVLQIVRPRQPAGSNFWPPDLNEDPDENPGENPPDLDPWLPLTDLALDPLGPAEAQARLNSESGWFDGHFPGRPLLPGVALIALAGRTAELAEKAQGRRFRLSGFKKIKFKQIVRPNRKMRITVTPDPSGRPGLFTMDAALKEGTACSGILEGNGEH